MKGENMKKNQMLEKIESLEGLGYSRQFVAMIYVHFITGCRISDLLRLTGRDFTNNYYVRISQGKNSDDLIYHIDRYHDIIDIWRSSGIRISGTYSRQSIYRIYTKIGISVNRGSNRNKSVTHAFRVAIARDIVNSGMAKSVASKALGHKSKRSIDYYLNDIPSKARFNQNVFNAPSGELEDMRVNRLGRIYMKNR